MALPSFLQDKRLHLVFMGGKGGVGKTTCAAATALYLAQHRPQDRFLLLSTDPAHSVSDCLADFRPPANLHVLELDAHQAMTAFKKEHREKLHQIASRGTFLDTEDLDGLLDLSLPGLDEIMAFLEISQQIQRQNYHCTVVDTAPTGHTLRLLAMPDLLQRWLAVLDTLLGKHRYLKRTFAGSWEKDELDRFLQGFSLSIQQLRSLMKDPRHSRFVPVMLAEALSIQETLFLLQEAEGLGLAVADVVVNQLYPESTCPQCSRKRNAQLKHLRDLFGQGGFRYPLWGLPLYPDAICGQGHLAGFWQAASRIREDRLPSPAATSWSAESRQPVYQPPRQETGLIIFAGKGGVGKTTLASATALWLNKMRQDKEILLCSIDPAHSLAACLLRSVGPVPTRLLPGLTAVEIDAPSEFEHLKSQYTGELEHFLLRLSPNLDLTFDRQVLEKILDLSPPGVDELMALTAVVDLLATKSYDLLILDSAPTGHLLRLLELPELVTQWLQALFGIFLKYKAVLRLPKLVQRLVRLSKQVKMLRALLQNPGSCSLFAVSIPTAMAYQETLDLLSACRRLGIFVPLLFLNLFTQASECALCSALHARESLLSDQYRNSFPYLEQRIVVRQEEPHGLEQLQLMGQRLYGLLANFP